MYSTVDIKKRIGTPVSTVHTSYGDKRFKHSQHVLFQTLLFLFETWHILYGQSQLRENSFH